MLLMNCAFFEKSQYFEEFDNTLTNINIHKNFINRAIKQF